MAQVTKRVAKYDFALTNPGNGATTQLIGPIDLSHAQALVLQCKLTAVGGDAGDLFDIYLQDSADGVTWNDRMHLPQLNAGMTVSAVAPEVRRQTVMNRVLLAADEEAYESTGSAGAARLAAGISINGVFLPPYFDTTTNRRAANWRFSLEVSSDADGDADFSGTLTLYAQTDC